MSAPADFIPVAEESALIVEIGAWTLMQACHESAAAFGVGRGRPGRSDVNLSRAPARPARPARARRRLPALERAARAPAAARAQGDRAAGRAQDRAAQPRRTLRELGVGLALDDFGTGYSSLRDLPVAAVKIDRSFVGQLGTSPGDTAIVAAIVSLARALGIDAIAEGVENEEQAAQLRELGCPLAQGYLFGAPGTRITSGP